MQRESALKERLREIHLRMVKSERRIRMRRWGDAAGGVPGRDSGAQAHG